MFNIIQYYDIIREAAKEEFTEDNTPTLNAFLKDCFQESLNDASKELHLNRPEKECDKWIPKRAVDAVDAVDAVEDAMILEIMKVRDAIRKKHPEGKEFISGTIPCPICKTGIVQYNINDHYNGHIHAHCSTKDCVDWME